MKDSKSRTRFIGPKRVEYLFVQQTQQWEARYPAFVKREQQRVLQRWAGYHSLKRVWAWSQEPVITKEV